ncbi:reverse transcriptase family protein [Fluviicola chungangensis]|uniref:RNA-directed DNA polymerase n=1 Tax=Fluviicola chungangensis TaxID=2597671 RepID=A0A556MYJ0_9FLAO|nr:reverse transcriptase family protein [Fluviicola chungangensis]TSJ44984.1 RNA-directed DNA polymerase [Fluviicola chungangensis]
MISSEFEKSEFKKFCHNIGIKKELVSEVSSNLDSYYKEWEEIKKDKVTGESKKYKDGTVKKRIIRPSLKELKVIQRAIKERILVPISMPSNIHGGVKKRSNITNAKPHQGKKFQFTTDLQDFYPSIKYDRVYDTFLKLKFSNHYSHWLTKFTTWKYELPQGTPTSTHVSNIVFLETDFRLIEFCNRQGITYTRYVDDLTFSSQQCFKEHLQTLLEIVMDSGFKLSRRKTKYEGFQNITGIDVFNNYIDAPKKILEKTKEGIALRRDLKAYQIYVENIRKTNRRGR